ncbi:MAG: presenilin family intramembrane aspartyl protease, partial [Candidatus Thermoplasmatota archaeon]|nr:presenilin family intramembrane aspartyl protease [Candidatus Thermoplasmatota archaeon]
YNFQGSALLSLAVLVGALCGFVALMMFVMKGKAHAGLPFLNGGAIAGYFIGALVLGIQLF